MKTSMTAIAAAGVFAFAAVSVPNDAQAQCRGCGFGFGLLGGLADNDFGRPNNAHLFGIAPAFDERGVEVAPLLRHQPHPLAGAEHVVDKSCGSAAPA